MSDWIEYETAEEFDEIQAQARAEVAARMTTRNPDNRITRATATRERNQAKRANRLRIEGFQATLAVFAAVADALADPDTWARA